MILEVINPQDVGLHPQLFHHQNKERIKELVEEARCIKSAPQGGFPNPDIFYRWLASAFGELEIDELQQMRPS